MIKIEDKIEIFKALSDKNRLLILDMLSCGELCACDIMDGLSLTQPTISHHMKMLLKSDLVRSRKEGKWVFYSINQEKVNDIEDFIKALTSPKEECICKGYDTDCIKIEKVI
ncbi:ArsR family transcriptional regulator [Acetoanaerobium pronyense]|uniref:ArsR family transcriptional regulator n=1 Tax=Acetoanaerobium pronyense TaxID=1482736 RepID=A0ABS4KIZ0_9FIRM|nr:ArsR family transcriptional regulator [Acetoanaerobium pronyense]